MTSPDQVPDVNTGEREGSDMDDCRAFPDGLPLMRPRVPTAEELSPFLTEMAESGYMSNFGPICQRYEATLAEQLDVRHCLALANLSSGLMFMPHAAGLDGGEVILPSYTFVATAHSMRMAGLTPVFADVDPLTFCLEPESVEAAIGPDTVAICGVHIYGTPCDVEALQRIADKHSLVLFYDSAHGIGSHVGGRPLGGFGLAEGFSTSVTKIFTTMGEGGFITTNDDRFAEQIRAAREWGRFSGDNAEFPSIVSKLSEVCAAAGLIELPRLSEYVAHRRMLVDLAREIFRDTLGIRLPVVAEGNGSGHKDLAVMIDPDRFGIDRDSLATRLKEQGIETRAYFSPAVHQMEAYHDLNHRVSLTNTELAASQALCLPIFNAMTADQMSRLCETILTIRQQHVTTIKS